MEKILFPETIALAPGSGRRLTAYLLELALFHFIITGNVSSPRMSG